MSPTDKNPLDAGKYSSEKNDYNDREGVLLEELKSDKYDGSISRNKFDYLFGDIYIVKEPNQIKYVGNTGVYSEETANIYDDYSTISELNNNDYAIDEWVNNQIIKALKENPNASVLDIAQEARKEWIENRQKEILNDTQLKLAEAYGLRQEVGEDGRIRFVSDSNDEKTQLIIDFLDYISGDTQGYYDFNSKSTAAHHVIAISLTNGDPSTFSHELAHHYVRMFWRSKLIQTSLRAVDKPGMSDE